MGLLDTLLGHAGEKSLDDIAADFAPLLAPGETLQHAFGFVRDLYVFTDRRLILINKQGEPIGTRIFGPVVRELRARKYMKIISLAPEVL